MKQPALKFSLNIATNIEKNMSNSYDEFIGYIIHKIESSLNSAFSYELLFSLIDLYETFERYNYTIKGFRDSQSIIKVPNIVVIRLCTYFTNIGLEAEYSYDNDELKITVPIFSEEHLRKIAAQS